MTSDTKEGDGSHVGSAGEKHALDGTATGEQKKGVVNRVAPKTSVHKHSFSAWKFMLGLILVAYTWKYFMYNRVRISRHCNLYILSRSNLSIDLHMLGPLIALSDSAQAVQTLLDAEQRHNEQMEDVSN
jgi:hypothetical protein